MSTLGSLASKYAASIEKFNGGDVAAFAELLAEHCEFSGSNGPVGSSRAEIVERLGAVRAAVGWQTHEIISSSEAGTALAVVAKNTFADGSERFVAGCALFEDGLIVQMRSLGGMPS